MVADRLKRLRASRKLSQKDFAKALNVSQQTVASWESNRTEPSHTVLAEIADYFNVTTDYLLGRKEKVPVLSDEHTEVLKSYDALNSAGRHDFWCYFEFLKFKYTPHQQAAAV